MLTNVDHLSSKRDRLQMKPKRQRRGIATVWVIVWTPAIFTLLIVVSDVANVWQAKIELKTALEASSLAGVQQWELDSGNLNDPRAVAVSAAFGNTLIGQPVVVFANGGGGGANENTSCTENVVILGSIDRNVSPLVFNAGVAPSIANQDDFAVHVQATVQVQSLWNAFGGFSFGPYDVSAEATARFVYGDTKPRLVSIANSICPGP